MVTGLDTADESAKVHGITVYAPAPDSLRGKDCSHWFVVDGDSLNLDIIDVVEKLLRQSYDVIAV